MAAMKHQVLAHASVDLATALEQSNAYMAQSLRGPDFKEAVASYLEKRPPAFAPLGEGTTIDLT